MTTRYTHMRPRPEVDASVELPLDIKLMHMAASFMFVCLIVGALVGGARGWIGGFEVCASECMSLL
jgi:hypothetical protein